MVDIYLLSFYLLATYQPFASSQYLYKYKLIQYFLLEVADRRRSRSGSQDLTNDDITNTLLNEDNIEETLVINNPRTVTPDEAKSKTDDKIVDEIPVETKTEPLDGSETGVTALPFSTSSLLVTDQKTKLYLKPPMSPELLIAIAVRNLDPDKAAG